MEIRFRRAFYRPGEPVTLRIALAPHDLQKMATARTEVQLQARVSHLVETVLEIERQTSVHELARGVSLSLALPATAPRGYGLDLTLFDGQVQVLARASVGFDVLNHWTESPRYGFLTDFAPGRGDVGETMQQLTRYHINALQFYDWMYRHDTLLPPRDVYRDPLGRELSLQTVRALIDAAHDHNMAAMPYTAVYAASPQFYEQHPQWALYDRDGAVRWFADGFLAYMDPRPESGWTRHLLAQFAQVLRETAFDGIHLDQYGEPRLGYDVEGRPFDLQEPLAELIVATKEVVAQRREHGAVVFNCVGNWPVRAAAPAPQDLVYIEVWEPFVTLSDLQRLVLDAQRFGGGKPVVLAAYVDPSWEHNMRLMDAIIFASGGGRIEIGEHADVLADPYFPKHQPMTPDLAAAMGRLHDFAVRYQDVLGPRTVRAPGNVQVTISDVDSGAQPGKVWPILRYAEDRTGSTTAISLVNLRGLAHGRWDQALGKPRPLNEVLVEVRGLSGDARKLWWASPDQASMAAQPLPAQVGGGGQRQTLRFTLPSLAYWDLIVIETATKG